VVRIGKGLLVHTETLTKLHGRFGAHTLRESAFRGDYRVVCAPEQVYGILEFLKNECGFDMLVDVTAVDYLEYRGARDRFGVVYALLATERGERWFVKTMLNEPDLTLPSVYPLWQGANWLEREVYDMFGIRFDGHPDLRRILLPEQFAAYPLRKDYPLRGRGERHNFERITRAES
jgi:NADH-quinone oxidoreductase subunit C